MNWPDKIFLVGMPGSGKSTLGRSLAEELNVKFIDLDEAIEQAEGSYIKDIFDSKGESYFRSLEAITLSKVIDSEERFVLATGGGTPCFYNSIDLINANGLSIFINVSTSALAERLKKTKIEERPKLKDVDLSIELAKTLEKRNEYYQKAALTLDSDSATVDELKKLFLKEYPK